MNPIVISNVIREESKKRNFGEECVDELSNKLKREIIDSNDGDRYDYLLFDDKFFKENQIFIKDVAAAQAACERDPDNAQNFKNYALAFTRLTYILRYHSKREQLNKDAKSLLEKALAMDATDYETMYELAIVHFLILKRDSTLETYGEDYMKLCHDAIRYFKQVQAKAPHIYKEESWLEVINQFLPNLELELQHEDISRLESSPSSEYIKWDLEDKRLTEAMCAGFLYVGRNITFECGFNNLESLDSET